MNCSVLSPAKGCCTLTLPRLAFRSSSSLQLAAVYCRHAAPRSEHKTHPTAKPHTVALGRSGGAVGVRGIEVMASQSTGINQSWAKML